MIRHLLLMILAYASLVLDAGSSGWSLPAGTAPPFLLMTAAVALLMCDGAAAIGWAVVAGLLSDVLARGPLGLNVVLLANLSFFAQVFGMRSLRDSAFATGGVVWTYATLASLGSLTMRSVLHGAVIDMSYFARYAAGRAGAAVSLFLIVMLSWKLMNRTFRFVLPSAKAGSERRLVDQRLTATR